MPNVHAHACRLLRVPGARCLVDRERVAVGVVRRVRLGQGLVEALKCQSIQQGRGVSWEKALLSSEPERREHPPLGSSHPYALLIQAQYVFAGTLYRMYWQGEADAEHESCVPVQCSVHGWGSNPGVC